MVKMTRAEAEKALEKKFLDKVVSFTDIREKIHCGKVHKISAWVDGGELMVIVVIDKIRFEVDINYFLENTDIHGNT